MSFRVRLHFINDTEEGLTMSICSEEFRKTASREWRKT